MGLIEVVIDLQGAAEIPAVHIDGDRRDLRLDACRGLALWFIFIDHIPDNVFAWLTLRNYGFSDTTEVFVFVSGYTCMLAYGGALREQGWPTTVTRALRRGWEIYAAFLLLLIAYLALIWAVGGDSRYLDETNTAFFFRDPGAAIVHAVVLQYTPVNTDILPTFVLLHLAFPGLLWLLTRSAVVALAVVVSRLTPPEWHGLMKPSITAMIRCGENSLAIYCFGVLLSFIGHVVLIKFSGTIAMQAAVSIAGVVLMVIAATLMTWEAKVDRRGPRLF